MNYFGQNIKGIREYWGLSQEEFGFLINASRGMIAQYETRGSRPKREIQIRIEELTGFSLEELQAGVIQRDDYPGMKDSLRFDIQIFRKVKSDNDAQHVVTGSEFEMRKAGHILKTKRKQLGLSIKELAKKFNVTTSYYEEIEEGAATPNVKLLDDIVSDLDAFEVKNLYFPDLFDIDGLPTPNDPEDIIQDGIIGKKWPGVPMYDIPVTAGAVTMIRDEKAPEPAYYLQIPSFKDCTFGARVSGDSMYPEIRNGDYVVCKEVQTLESLIYGDIYLIITKDGIETVKYVHPHENTDWVNLVPYNKSVPITPMPKSNIFKVYKVKGVLKGY
jgi:transcriptional regulator with XRE-family HTH domain